jgi:tetratricopeptide (TPR) repeat protein
MSRRKRQNATIATEKAGQRLRPADDNRPTSAVAAAAPLISGYDWLFAAALIVAVFLAYQPAWQGGFIWDDNVHVTKPELRSLQGLYHIWFDIGATQQYYPLLYSAFWFEHRLWGDATLGYHLLNILLHCLAALMVAIILRRLKIPGAFLAAAIFALHPVHVESVAWITEQKNTLSAVFYLAAAIAYLRFDQDRNRSSYGWALALFVAALLSKPVTSTLPAALLVVLWWQRGRLSWRRDVWPLLPFFVIGLASGILTAWVERKLIGAEGAPFDLTLVERCLLAGRVMWFYLGKLAWPADLLFVYPHWQISQAVWWQYVFPAGALLMLAVLWKLRRQWRGPLAALLFFAGTLFPVLGFFNVYLFVYTYVADHFQYLASLGLITLASAGVAMLLDRWGLWRRPGGYVLCLGLLGVLAGLTFHQSRMYTDIETLYHTTLAANPDCWMAHNNLGLLLADSDRLEKAVIEYRKALAIKPDFELAHINLGGALIRCGQIDEAMAHCRKALELSPNFAEAHNNLGNALKEQGQIDEAMAQYREALRIKPDLPEAHYSLATALAGRGAIDEAVFQYQEGLKIKPDDAKAHYSFALMLAGSGRADEAIAEYQKALEIDPNYAEAHNNLGNVLKAQGRVDEAIAQYREAVRIKPSLAEAHFNLASIFAGRGAIDEAILQYQQGLKITDNAQAHYNLALILTGVGRANEAIAHYEKVLKANPDFADAWNKLAWLRATSADASIRNAKEAVELAQRAAKLSGGKEPAILDTLAATYAEAGQFSEAVKTARTALNIAMEQKLQPLADALRAKIALYEAGKPFHQPLPAPATPPTKP